MSTTHGLRVFQLHDNAALSELNLSATPYPGPSPRFLESHIQRFLEFSSLNTILKNVPFHSYLVKAALWLTNVLAKAAHCHSGFGGALLVFSGGQV